MNNIVLSMNLKKKDKFKLINQSMLFDIFITNINDQKLACCKNTSRIITCYNYFFVRSINEFSPPNIDDHLSDNVFG